MAQVFLSYSRKDADVAKTIATALVENGHVVWWDKHISGGSKFSAEIEQALEAAELVIVLWSTNSVASPWVLDEAAEGRDTDRLIPIALDDCKPPLGFRQFQTIAAQSNLEDAVDEVLDAIARRSGDRRPATRASGHAAGTPGNAASHAALARRLAEQGRFKDAWREIETALRTDCDCTEANSCAGWILYMQGRAEEAIAYYDRASAGSKADYESPAMLISCYRSVGDNAGVNRAAALALARAEQSAASALSKGPAFAFGAKALAALGHTERARKWLRKALNIEPGNLPMRYHLAATLASLLGDTEAAIDVLEPFVEGASKPGDLLLLESDPDWAPLRETRAFQTLLSRARKRVRAFETT